MPLIPVFLLLLLPVVIVLAMPFALVQRYRFGTARRPGRRWVAKVNLLLMLLSAALFIWGAAFTNFWVPRTFQYALLGLAGGGMLGLLGLALTRWETTPQSFHYTPSRFLVLIITFAVSARLLYGFWRGWHAWIERGHGTAWLAASGAAGSLGVGAMVLGYYLSYSAGIYWRTRRHAKRYGT